MAATNESVKLSSASAAILSIFASAWGTSAAEVLVRAEERPEEVQEWVAVVLRSGGGEAFAGLSRERICRATVEILARSGAHAAGAARQHFAGAKAPSGRVNHTDLYAGRLGGMSRAEAAALMLQQEEAERSQCGEATPLDSTG